MKADPNEKRLVRHNDLKKQDKKIKSEDRKENAKLDQRKGKK